MCLKIDNGLILVEQSASFGLERTEYFLFVALEKEKVIVAALLAVNSAKQGFDGFGRTCRFEHILNCFHDKCLKMFSIILGQTPATSFMLAVLKVFFSLLFLLD